MSKIDVISVLVTVYVVLRIIDMLINTSKNKKS